ncbi:MAG: bifunctional DNA-formamidopyrimidine glycosylase/DNA-(apurinic or apyrimidinic site) lyase [Candidatus Shapirobacteria bacterium]
MPELPEVEVVRLFLEPYLVGSTVTKLEILTPKSFAGDPGLLIGQQITSLSRIGKQLSIHLNNGYIALVHLKMTGQLILVPSKQERLLMGHPTKDMDTQILPNKSTRLVFSFDNGAVLYFNDQRKFGWIKLMTAPEIEASQSNLGHDIFDPRFTPDYVYSQLQRSSRPVKLVLLDQHFFAGVGNIYANDALFLSRLHPLTKSNLVTISQSRLIHQHLIEIMRQSVLVGGSTARDNKYLRPDGTPGQNQFQFRVYQREGEPCLVCQAPLKRLKLGGRGTFYCPQCQRL